MGVADIGFDSFASFDFGLFDEFSKGLDLKIFVLVNLSPSTMDSLHCKGSKVGCYGFNCHVRESKESDEPMMVMVGTARSAYTMKIGFPASVVGKKSPNPIVKKNLSLAH